MPERSDATAWTKVAFGDVVRQVKDRVDPEQSGLERYVAGEHMDTDDLRLRRWGDIGDGYLGPAFHMRFKPGQVLYGSRRTYLRKVAVADFEGITANTTYVLEPKDPKALLPELLPYIMQSDAFIQHSVRESKGSVNPYVNFSDLAWYEFALPPLNEQRRILSVLKSAAECKDTHLAAADAAVTAREALVEDRMRGLSMGRVRRNERVGRYCADWRVFRLGELVTMTQYGLSDVAKDTGRFPMLRMMNIESGRVVENDLKYIDLDPADHVRYQLANGDVLFNRTNSYDLVGRTGVYELGGDHVFASYLVRIRTDGDRLNPDYLCAFLNAPVGRRQVMSFATRGVSQANVNASSLRRVLIPLPSIEYQVRTVAAVRSLADASECSRARAADAGRIIARVVNADLTR